MQFGIQALVFGVNIQHAGALCFSIHVHGHFGIECTVVFVELLAVHHLGAVLAEFHAVRLVNTGHIGAGDVVDGAVGNDHVGSGGGGIHIFRGRLGIRGAALIDVVEDHGRRHGTGDIRAVQDQRHHSIGVFLRILPQVHGHLPGRQRAAEHICSRLGDMDYRVGVGFRLAVFVGFGALSIGDPLTLQIKHDIVGSVDCRRLIRGGGLAVYGDRIVR